MAYVYANKLSCVGCYVRTLSNTHAKADQHHAELIDRFVDYMSLLIRQLYHFCNRYRSWVAATGGQ